MRISRKNLRKIFSKSKMEKNTSGLSGKMGKKVAMQILETSKSLTCGGAYEVVY